MSELMMPQHANIMGNVFGGVILALVDRVAAVAAIRHAGKPCVTVSVDKVDFRSDPRGRAAHRLRARQLRRAHVDGGGREDHRRERAHGREAAHQLVLRHLRGARPTGVPTAVPPIIPETADEKRRFDRAAKRRATRVMDRDTMRGAGSEGGRGLRRRRGEVARLCRRLEGARGGKPHAVAPRGTSMGAVIAAAFASGASYDEVVIAARSLSRRDVAPLDPIALLKGAFAGSILKAQGPRRAIERLVPATRFEQLKSPLTITATDLDSGELLLFGTGGRSDLPLHDALYASCALPLYFPPLSLDGRRLGDGGLRACWGSSRRARSRPIWSSPSMSARVRRATPPAAHQCLRWSGPRRGDPRDDGGAGRAADRRLAEGRAAARSGATDRRAGSDVCGRLGRPLPAGGVRRDETGAGG